MVQRVFFRFRLVETVKPSNAVCPATFKTCPCGYFATEILIDSSSAVTGVVDRLDSPIELVVREREYPNLFFRVLRQTQARKRPSLS